MRVSRARQLRVKFTAGLACKLCSLLLIVHFSLHFIILFTALHNTFHFSLHYIVSIASPLVHTSTQSSSSAAVFSIFTQVSVGCGPAAGHQVARGEKFSTPTHYYLRGQRRCIAAFFIPKSNWSQTSYVISYASTKINCLHVWCGPICHDLWHNSQLRPFFPPF